MGALGFTLPMQQLIIGLQVGLGIATTAINFHTVPHFTDVGISTAMAA